MNKNNSSSFFISVKKQSNPIKEIYTRQYICKYLASKLSFGFLFKNSYISLIYTRENEVKSEYFESFFLLLSQNNLSLLIILLISSFFLPNLFDFFLECLLDFVTFSEYF